MKNKIIVSLLLVLLIAISASAVSASEDLDDTITETSDSSSDIEITNEDTANIETICEDSDEADMIDEDIKTDNKLGDNGVNIGNNPASVSNLESFTKYVGKSNFYTNGQIFILNDNYIFNLTSPQNLEISCTIKGGTLKAENLDYFFKIDSPSNGGPKSITIKDTTFIVTKDQNIIFANGKLQGINNVLDIAGITLENITIQIEADTDYQANNALLYIDTYNDYISNEIKIVNNNLNGFKSINFANRIIDNSDVFLESTDIIYAKNTRIESKDITKYVIDKSIGDSPFTFELKLIDENNNPVANKTVSFVVNYEKIFATTNSNGIASFLLSFSTAKKYDVYSIFEGDGWEYKPSDMVANYITIKKKVSSLTLKNVSYKATATKKLSATFKDKNNKLIKNKKIIFTVNGKTYTATTNSKGVATVKITLNKKGKYTYSAKFAGDGLYEAVTKKATLTINPLSTSLTTKKYTYKKAAKTKKISVTLKTGSKVIKGQKVTIKVNGKTYTAKTNSKGVATVKVSLKKKGTFKYTAKYAGNNIYKATSKTNKLVIK